MDFVTIPFPECIALGAQGDTFWSTNVVTTGGGFDATNQNWRDARHAYDVSFAVRTVSDYQAIRAHFHQVRGRAKKFLFRDFLDYAVAQSEGVLLDDDLDPPSANGSFQLHKEYGSGGDAYARKITRPQSPIVVYRTRAGVTTVISPTVDYTTGQVTITGHQSGDTYAWSGEFSVPCRYDTDRLPALAINREPGSDGELYVQCSSIQIVEVRE